MPVRDHDIPLSVAPNAGGTAVAYSDNLENIAMIRKALFIFPAATSLKLILRLFWSTDLKALQSSATSGTEITLGDVQAGAFVGESIAYEAEFQKVISAASIYLKLYGENNATTNLVGAAVIRVLENA